VSLFLKKKKKKKSKIKNDPHTFPRTFPDANFRNSSRSFTLAAMLAVCALAFSAAYALPMRVQIPAVHRSPAPAMGLFDGLKGAFSNDDTLGARSNAGLSKEGTKRTITWVGPTGKEKKSIVVAGQRLKDVARAAGVPVKYDCSEGSCKTCEAQMGNGKIKICVAKVIDRDITIKYGLRQKD